MYSSIGKGEVFLKNNIQSNDFPGSIKTNSSPLIKMLGRLHVFIGRVFTWNLKEKHLLPKAKYYTYEGACKKFQKHNHVKPRGKKIKG